MQNVYATQLRIIVIFCLGVCVCFVHVDCYVQRRMIILCNEIIFQMVVK